MQVQNGSITVVRLATAGQTPLSRADTGCEWLHDCGACEAASQEVDDISSEHGQAVTQLQHQRTSCKQHIGVINKSRYPHDEGSKAGVPAAASLQIRQP